MNKEDKERIEKEAATASKQSLPWEVPVSTIYHWGYVAGATKENERIDEQLKQERNKAIEAMIDAFCEDMETEKRENKEFHPTQYYMIMEHVVEKIKSLKH